MTNVEPGARQKCVVLDTQVWREQLQLRTKLGSTLLYALKTLDAKLGLPWIVEREMEIEILAAGIDAVKKVEEGLRTLQRIIGRSPRPRMPDEAALRDSIRARLDELSYFIERVPPSFELAQAGLERVFKKLPPNTQKVEQYRDSVIWESCRQLTKHFDVYFVSGDKAFQDSSGWSRTLLGEVNEAGLPLRGFTSLADCLAVLQPEIPTPDEQTLLMMIYEWLLPKIEEKAAVQGFKINRAAEDNGLLVGHVQVFMTEVPSKLFASFTLAADLFDAAGDSGQMVNAHYVQHGTCSLDARDFTPSEFESEGEEFRWFEDGEPKSRIAHYLRVHDTVHGTSAEAYSFRAPIPWALDE